MNPNSFDEDLKYPEESPSIWGQPGNDVTPSNESIINDEVKQPTPMTPLTPMSHNNNISPHNISKGYSKVAESIYNVSLLRDKWLYKPKRNESNGNILTDEAIHALIKSCNDKTIKYSNTNYDNIECVFNNGMAYLHCMNEDQQRIEIFSVGDDRSFEAFQTDLDSIIALNKNGPVNTTCYIRLKTIIKRFELYEIENQNYEKKQVKMTKSMDYYRVRKIDNHIHHSACFTQTHMLEFIKKVYNRDKNRMIMKGVTLKDKFEELKVDPDNLNVDILDMHAHHGTGIFKRFDNFKRKYNPAMQSELRKLFLRYDNCMNGEYLCEITKEVLKKMKEQETCYAEWRISVNGKNGKNGEIGYEWNVLSKWIIENELHDKQIRWLIQIPRKYDVNKRKGYVNNFGDMLRNIFQPLFEVTLNPNKNMELYIFLQMIVGFDCVDSEAKSGKRMPKYPLPNNWNTDDNPPYMMYMYYIYINLHKLNQLREQQGLNTFQLRPHAGEAGQYGYENLATCYMVADSINHGIQLHHNVVLQYLYYIKQIGISVSPLSNDKLCKKLKNNPFAVFFKKGLNVSLSTGIFYVYIHKQYIIQYINILHSIYMYMDIL